MNYDNFWKLEIFIHMPTVNLISEKPVHNTIILPYIKVLYIILSNTRDDLKGVSAKSTPNTNDNVPHLYHVHGPILCASICAIGQGYTNHLCLVQNDRSGKGFLDGGFP